MRLLLLMFHVLLVWCSATVFNTQCQNKPNDFKVFQELKVCNKDSVTLRNGERTVILDTKLAQTELLRTSSKTNHFSLLSHTQHCTKGLGNRKLET